MSDAPAPSALRTNLRTLGVFLLVFGGPLLALRVACVSYRELCEGQGGHYGEVGELRVCNFPEPQHACPKPYRYSRTGDGCNARGTLDGVWRWQTWD